MTSLPTKLSPMMPLITSNASVVSSEQSSMTLLRYDRVKNGYYQENSKQDTPPSSLINKAVTSVDDKYSLQGILRRDKPKEEGSERFLNVRMNTSHICVKEFYHVEGCGRKAFFSAGGEWVALRNFA